MINRFITLIICAVTCSLVTSYIVSGNLLDAFYPPEANGTTIQILQMQFLLTVLLIASMPIIFLGSHRLRSWTKEGAKIKFALTLVIGSLSYLLTAFIEFAIVDAWFNRNWKISTIALVLAIPTMFFLISDSKWVTSRKFR
jgi:heme/copper-type cytochrome/quinol oxidase subunit 3